jgi:plastocyanin
MKSVAAALILGASMAYAENHIVTLGQGGQLVFTPNSITAAIGDTVTFQFLAGVRFYSRQF